MPSICSQISLAATADQTADGDSSLAAFRSLRTLRALRPLRAISRWEGMKVIELHPSMIIEFMNINCC